MENQFYVAAYNPHTGGFAILDRESSATSERFSSVPQLVSRWYELSRELGLYSPESAIDLHPPLPPDLPPPSCPTMRHPLRADLAQLDRAAPAIMPTLDIPGLPAPLTPPTTYYPPMPPTPQPPIGVLPQLDLPGAERGVVVLPPEVGANAGLATATRTIEVERWDVEVTGLLTHKITRRKVRVSISAQPFARGNLRAAYYMSEHPPGRPPIPCVAKVMLRPDDATEEAYVADVVTQRVAQWFARAYTDHTPKPPKPVAFVDAWLIVVPGAGGGFMACEPLLKGFWQRYTNNYGAVVTDRNTPCAFSHFTLHHSGGRVLVCDIQGVDDMYTDPQINSADGVGYGLGNCGADGIRQFCRTHRCNHICVGLNLPTKDFGVKRRDHSTAFPKRSPPPDAGGGGLGRLFARIAAPPAPLPAAPPPPPPAAVVHSPSGAVPMGSPIGVPHGGGGGVLPGGARPNPNPVSPSGRRAGAYPPPGHPPPGHGAGHPAPHHAPPHAAAHAPGGSGGGGAPARPVSPGRMGMGDRLGQWVDKVMPPRR